LEFVAAGAVGYCYGFHCFRSLFRFTLAEFFASLSEAQIQRF